MSSSSPTVYNDLFSSLISEIKSYSGKDPLLPWLRGIKKMRETLPAELLEEKLPRFLQKCAHTFQSDRRYSNDLRYVRVWIQLMDFVEDPKGVLRAMEMNGIGAKKSLFYQAYALYYEKRKKFDAAEKIYHLGVENLAEPIDELQKSYEQFLIRMERHKRKRTQWQGGKTTNHQLSAVHENGLNLCRIKGTKDEFKEANYDQEGRIEVKVDQPLDKEVMYDGGRRSFVKTEAKPNERRNFHGEDTVIAKFVDTAIVGKSNAEDARHHGLVEPTINTKEAMNAINSMFREPLEPSAAGNKSRKSQGKGQKSSDNRLEVFIDDYSDHKATSSCQKTQNLGNSSAVSASSRAETDQHQAEPFQIYIDGEETNEVSGRFAEKDLLRDSQVEISTEGPKLSGGRVNAFVFPSPKDLSTESSHDSDAMKQHQSRFREDTVVYRFVGSTISEEPKVENVCHHGLVEPTINLKEAMDDINSMFGKPIEFVRKSRPKNKEKAPDMNKNCSGFLILPDDEQVYEPKQRLPISSAKHQMELSEPTLCMKEAMDEINKMFAMPLDF